MTKKAGYYTDSVGDIWLRIGSHAIIYQEKGGQNP